MITYLDVHYHGGRDNSVSLKQLIKLGRQYNIPHQELFIPVQNLLFFALHSQGCTVLVYDVFTCLVLPWFFIQNSLRSLTTLLRLHSWVNICHKYLRDWNQIYVIKMFDIDNSVEYGWTSRLLFLCNYYWENPLSPLHIRSRLNSILKTMKHYNWINPHYDIACG